MGWWIALGILVALAVLPLGVSLVYDCDGLELDALVGLLHIHLLPKKKDVPKKEKKKKEKKPVKKGKKTAPASSPDQPKEQKKGGSITDFIPLVKTLLELLDTFRKKLRVKRLELKLIMAADDPCDLAINYGRANAAMGNLMPLLERCFVIKKRYVEVECDFEASETVILARADITITLGWLLGMVVWYGVRAVKEFIQIKNQRKGGASK